MLCARLYTPARIIAIDTDEYRLNLAKEKGLADVILMPGRDNIEEAVQSLTGGRGADTVFEVAEERILSRQRGKSPVPTR